MHNAFDRVGVVDNTYIIFASDNGGCPAGGGRNYPLRGTKGMVLTRHYAPTQCTFSMHPTNIPLQFTLTIHLFNTPYQHTLPIHPINTPSQHPFPLPFSTPLTTPQVLCLKGVYEWKHLFIRLKYR